ncbi:Acetyltransferase (GNAT) domain protein [uncultured archaeon]|nr:Acetyltransferase (GNAT) domain protein [uncultured archaeon]
MVHLVPDGKGGFIERQGELPTSRQMKWEDYAAVLTTPSGFEVEARAYRPEDRDAIKEFLQRNILAPRYVEGSNPFLRGDDYKRMLRIIDSRAPLVILGFDASKGGRLAGVVLGDMSHWGEGDANQTLMRIVTESLREQGLSDAVESVDLDSNAPIPQKGVEATYIVDKDFRGQGVARTLLLAFITEAHSRMGISDFRLAINEENEPSVHVAQACGFSLDNSTSHPSGRVVQTYRRLITP